MNRINSVIDTGYSRSFQYDPYGNLWVTGNSGVPLAGNTPTANVYTSANRIGGGIYDAAGNQTVVNGNTLAYDAENRLITATDGVTHAVESYLYDGDGKRVEKTGPGGTTIYVYDALGQLAAEYATATTTSPCTTCYLVWDHLGSARLITDQNAAIVARHDYLPFGEEIPANTAGRDSHWGPGNDTVTQKFTGKERDTETGLDYFGARFYGSALGRFTSPDEFKGGIVDPFTGQDIETNTALPYADITDPQTLNKYAYVRNNPLRYTDPDGHCIEDLCIGEAAATTYVTTQVVQYLQTPQGQQGLQAIGQGIMQGAQSVAGALSNIFHASSNKTPQPVQPGSTDASKDQQSVQPGSSGGPTAGERFKPSQRAEDAGKQCSYCGQQTTEEPGKPNSRETDHADPRSRGGNTEPTNRNPSCRTCNREKGNKNVEKYQKYRKDKYGAWLSWPNQIDSWHYDERPEQMIWIFSKVS